MLIESQGKLGKDRQKWQTPWLGPFLISGKSHLISLVIYLLVNYTYNVTVLDCCCHLVFNYYLRGVLNLFHYFCNILVCWGLLSRGWINLFYANPLAKSFSDSERGLKSVPSMTTQKWYYSLLLECVDKTGLYLICILKKIGLYLVCDTDFFI